MPKYKYKNDLENRGGGMFLVQHMFTQFDTFVQLSPGTTALNFNMIGSSHNRGKHIVHDFVYV